MPVITEYVVGTKRKLLGTPPTALALAAAQADMTVKGASDPDVVVVDATANAAADLLRKHGDRVYVESSIPFDPA